MLAAFTGACFLLFLKPGPAMSVIVANSIGEGRRGGLITVAGNVAGFVLLILVVALGLAWIAEAMERWFAWVKLAGACFLFYLGAMRLWQAGRGGFGLMRSDGRLFRDGFIVAVANPEVLLFLAAFMVPFIDQARPVWPQLAILGAAFVSVSAIAGAALALLAAQARNVLAGDWLVWLDRASGGLLILAAIWLGYPS